MQHIKRGNFEGEVSFFFFFFFNFLKFIYLMNSYFSVFDTSFIKFDPKHSNVTTEKGPKILFVFFLIF